MGATRAPVITNPGSDPGRNQPKETATDANDVRGARVYRDPQSMAHNPGGAATSRKMWTDERYESGIGSNGAGPKDRGNRS